MKITVLLELLLTIKLILTCQVNTLEYLNNSLETSLKTQITCEMNVFHMLFQMFIRKRVTEIILKYNIHLNSSIVEFQLNNIRQHL